MTAALAPGTKRDVFPFSVYKADAVKARLEELFHGKCAYCESLYASQAPVDVEHFRPKGEVEEDLIHPGYWWLAMDWTNLLPSCIDCNRRRKQKAPLVSGDLSVLYKNMKTGKQASFPVLGVRADREGADLSAEKALLIDPSRDDPDEHLEYWLGDDQASGLIYPKLTAPTPGAGPASPIAPAIAADAAGVAAHAAAGNLSLRGAVSIQVYGLNRVRLVQERARLLQQLRFLESVLLDVSEVASSLKTLNETVQRQELTDAVERLTRLRRRILDQMQALAEPEAPHASTARAYLRDFRNRVKS
jgi:uncharacterized protein (TIGR02646 family)